MKSRSVRALAAALITFAVIGTVTALWPNPLFGRTTPVQGFEVWLLALQSMLIGLYVAVRRPHCPVRRAGVGSVVAFLGIACPTCNKILLVLFGSGLLLEYFEPARLYVAAAGVVLTALALAGEYRAARLPSPLGANGAPTAFCKTPIRFLSQRSPWLRRGPPLRPMRSMPTARGAPPRP